VRELLTLSRQQMPELRPMNVRNSLTAISEMLPRVLSPAIQTEVRAADDVPELRADAGMLESMVMNLVVNARDAMPKGGHLKIFADAVEIGQEAARANPESRVGRFVRLTVSDTGCGIVPEILPRIFEPFFTTKPVGKGAGLGLAMVYGITRLHEGWVEVQSEVDVGTTFRVFIPSVSTPKAAQKPAARKPVGGGETILVVEDEPDLRDLVTQVLEAGGYKVISAGSGAEALDAWAKYRTEIRLLLSDMMLPDGFTGRSLAERLTGDNPRLRVIFTSGYSAGVPGTELANIEARQFLAKPYRPVTLLETVRRSLDEPQAALAGAPA
jgi:two-component system cell cycle sensor histidine kinase/response regulator CckA